MDQMQMERMSSAEQAGMGVAGVIVVLFELAIIGLLLASMWRVFTKAGQPGWAILIPFYNLYVMLKVAGKPGWWLVLMLIPLVNIVFAILLYMGLAESFGKGAGFGLGLLLLGFIFFPVLAFGDATYQRAPAT
jgi:hypothetical protein